MQQNQDLHQHKPSPFKMWQYSKKTGMSDKHKQAHLSLRLCLHKLWHALQALQGSAVALVCLSQFFPWSAYTQTHGMETPWGTGFRADSVAPPRSDKAAFVQADKVWAVLVKPFDCGLVLLGTGICVHQYCPTADVVDDLLFLLNWGLLPNRLPQCDQAVEISWVTSHINAQACGNISIVLLHQHCQLQLNCSFVP